MNRSASKLLFIFFTLMMFWTSASQNKKTIPLKEILKSIEETYNVRFSYEDNTIRSLKLEPFNGTESIEDLLQQLKALTGLEFRRLDERFIAVLRATPKNSTTKVQQLEEVVVSNYLTKGLSKTITGRIDFNRNAFEIFPGLIEPDVLQIAQKLPGIISVEERISNINVRGGTNDQNLILFDGIRMYQSGHFFGLISAFNPHITETLNITKNGTSAKYGDGVSSLFSIKTSNEVANRLTGGLGANMLGADAYVNAPISNKMSLQVSGRRSFMDVFRSSTFNAYFDRIFRDSELNAINDASTQLNVEDSFLFYDFNAKLLYDINQSSKLRVNVIRLFNSLDYNQIFTTNTNTTVEQNSSLNQSSLGVGANFSKEWKNGLNTSIEAYYSNYDLDANNANLTSNQRLIQENEIEDLGIRLDVSKQFKSIKIGGGYQFNEVGVTNFEEVTNPDFRSLVKEVIRTHALFTEVEWKSKAKSQFIRLGLRGNYFEKFERFIVEPRLVINQKLHDNFRLELIGELKSQSLNQIIDLQQDFFGIEKRRWQLANEQDVPIITSQQVSLGLSYNRKGWLISAEAYYKNVNDITARNQGFQNQFQFINDIGSFSVVGLEFLANKNFKRFSTWLGYTFSNNEYRFNNLNEGRAFANTLDITHVANASLTYNTKNIKVGMALNWHSGRPYTAISENQDLSNTSIEFETANENRLPSYFRTDISALYSFQLSQQTRAELGASIWNVLNRTNIINRFYSLEGSNTIVQVDNRALEFTPNFSFRIKF